MAEETDAQREARWRAESDANSVAEAAAVNSDPKRLKAAKTAAKKMQVEEKKRAAEAVLRSNALTNLATGNMTQTSTPKAKSNPHPKPKSKPKPTPKMKPKAKVVTKKKTVTKTKPKPKKAAPKPKAKPRAATPRRTAKKKR